MWYSALIAFMWNNGGLRSARGRRDIIMEACVQLGGEEISMEACVQLGGEEIL